MPRNERDEVGYLAPGNVVPHPGIYDLLLGGVRRHPGSRANDCRARNDGVKLAAPPEDGRSPTGKNLIAGLSVIDDEAGQLHPVVETCRSSTHQLQCQRTTLRKAKKTDR
jgi:hypothetical protein